LYVHNSGLSLFFELLQFIVMFRVEPVHEQTIGEDQQDEYYDTALMSKPETKRETGSRQFVKIKTVSK
jgi:hypothetical protein